MTVEKHGFSEYMRFEEAKDLILSEVELVGTEMVRFDECIGRVLSDDVSSDVDVPPFDRAAMDGLAVRAEDTFGVDESSPNRLDIIGSVEIGSSVDLRIGKKEALEIATGAPLPEGADAVVKIEETVIEGSEAKILAPVAPGKNVSSRGEDVESGQTIFEDGRRMRPWDVGLLASTGNLEVEVFERPEVGIAVTGGELRKPGEDLSPGEITDTNGYALSAAVKEFGGLPTHLGIVQDDIDSIREVLSRASEFDLFLFTGGTSVGEKDLVPDVIESVGEVVFHGVSMRPGSPTGFGKLDSTPIFSLSGFPAASLVAFEMLVKPALRKMIGLSPEDFRLQIDAELTRKVSSNLGRFDIVRTRLEQEEDRFRADPIRVTGSSMLRTLTSADGFFVIPEESEGYSEGEIVEASII